MTPAPLMSRFNPSVPFHDRREQPLQRLATDDVDLREGADATGHFNFLDAIGTLSGVATGDDNGGACPGQADRKGAA